jgi:hypothetical protein
VISTILFLPCKSSYYKLNNLEDLYKDIILFLNYIIIYFIYTLQIFILITYWTTWKIFIKTKYCFWNVNTHKNTKKTKLLVHKNTNNENIECKKWQTTDKEKSYIKETRHQQQTNTYSQQTRHQQQTNTYSQGTHKCTI